MDRNDHIEEVKNVFNHIGLLNDTEVVRCIGFAEDEEDYYWIVLSPSRGIIYSSKVGSFVSLKNLNYPRYDHLENAMHELWDVPRSEEFIMDVL
jgi:hypothetical protein